MTEKVYLRKKDVQKLAQSRAKNKLEPRPFALQEPEHKPLDGGMCSGNSLNYIHVSSGTVIPPKFVVSTPGDKYEQEADQIADQVVKIISSSDDLPVQRECRACMRRPKVDDELRLRPHAFGFVSHVRGADIEPELASAIQHSRGRGQPLSNSVRQPMERAFGTDFSRIKVHADHQADSFNRELQARAFTTGQDVFFSNAAYRPGTFEGRRLLAHELSHVVQQSRVIRAHSVDVINRMPDDFSQTSSAGDTLEVTTEMFTDKGAVRMWAGPQIVSSEGDRLRYQCFARVINRPFQVTVGIRTIAVHDIVVQRVFPRSRLQRWQESGILVLRPWSTTPGSGLEFFVSLIPTGAEPIEYSEPLQFDTSAVELSRVLNAEAGSSLAGMIAVAHVINNRLTSGSPSGQVDLSSEWPENFINTGFWLNRGRPRRNWPRVTSTASRALAKLIIQDGSPPGSDPTDGAIFYRSAARPDLETASPAFQHLRQEVERGHLRRKTIGGNVFYAPLIGP